MKKIFSILILIFLMLVTLTSCEVHWFDKSYDVEWYVIAIPVTVFSVIVFGIGGTVISKKKYVCPECRHKFHPSFWVSVVSVHVGSDRYFKCPRCGKRSFCKIARHDGESN